MRTIVVAGTCSGVGKTAIAVGLMAAYTRRGLRVQPFKIGPDFLDPMHHHAATGRHSYNLDAWMLSREANLACFRARVVDTDVAIVEGVMGLYDGRDGKSDAGSTADMAKLLSAPVLLVLDCWTLARSAAAIIRGYTTFDPALQFAGVVFNKVGSPAHTAWLTDAVQTTEPGIQVLGGLPKTAGIQLPQRHLGFQTCDDESLSVNSIQQLDDLVEQHLDLDAVFQSAALCQPGNGTETELLIEEEASTIPSSPSAAGKPVRIGVARDEAFCFYYQANLNLLEDAGAEVVYFSPLRDSLPPRLDAIIFGGGHPELYVAQLAANKPLLYAVRAFALAGGIVYGECGGLMYLSYGIEGTDGELFPMCGVFPFATRIQLVTHEGYVKVTPRNACVLFPAIIGEIRGQIYRSSEIFYPATNQVTDCPRGLTMKIDNAEAREELEGFMQGNAMATVVHLHFGSNPTVAPAFVERCRTNTTKAPAVAAASASAVAGAGPAAAAAAGAAAAAAVAAALGPPVPYHRSSVTLTELESPHAFSDAVVSMRRSESVGDFRSPRKATLLRSGSAVWSSGGEGATVTPERDGKYYYGGAPMVRVTASSLQGNRKVDVDVDDGTTYNLDVHRTSSRVGKVLNGKGWPERIVSLLPGATEILLEIGAGARLIAITDMCDRPRGVKIKRHVVCSSKVDVASMSSKNVDFALKSLIAKKESHCRLDVQWLSKAKPDLIISQDICEQCEMHDTMLTSMLAKSGVVSKNITRLITFSPKTVTEMLASIMRLGEAVNLYSEACLLLDSLRARLRRVAAAVAAQDRPRVLLLQGLDPLQVGGHWAFEMVTLAGGSEALQKPGCPPETLHAQRLSAYAPEVLVLAPRWSNLDRSLAEIEIVGRIPGFWSIPAVERREVYICNHSCFSFPGPRLVEGVELLAHILHPLAISQGLQIRETVLKLSLLTGQRCRPEDLTHHFHPLQ